MKATPLVVCCALALGRTAVAQAFGESIQISQPAMHSTGAATSVPTSPLQRSGLPQQVGVQVMNDAYRGQADCHCAKPPVFLPSPKDVAPGAVVILTSPSPNAVIYYTADGWTPTETSTKYETPIPILSNTRIQAFAIEPGKAPSPIVAGSYTLSGTPTPLPPDEAISGSTVPKGTPIRLQTGNRLTSETANVGDHFFVLLDQNLIVNGKMIAHRGMSVDAIVTAVKPAGQNGVSGMIVFRLAGLSANGVNIPLDGMYTLVAPDIGSQINHIADTSFVHVAGPLPQGNQAKIEPGMMLTASVASDVAVSQ
ncbi:MAG: chitobiase/beta-hexosaminidase C-terminal domain-containing protein [Acidobacteria bacterium]|nr:chitobiase/beta-hexosaminidase C-terminal domain-containing protein [Acidobacteriota bacterium]